MAFVTLKQADCTDIFDYIALEPEFNLFIYGDIEQFGVASDMVGVFANLCDGRWDSLVLRYRTYYILYSRYEAYDAQSVALFLQAQPQVDGISGKGSLLEKLASHLSGWHYRPTYLSSCSQVLIQEPALVDYSLRRLGSDDAYAVLDLLSGIEEFAKMYQGKDPVQECKAIVNDLTINGMGFGIFAGDQLVCCAKTSGQNAIGAVVVGVATLPDHRCQGLATACVTRLCRENFQQGRKCMVLFYDNPLAGKVYRRIGFEEIGTWGMLRRQ